MNLNPLIKLDGYYVLSETLGIDEIKERSTAVVVGWLQKHIFRLPFEVRYVRPRLRWLFVPYAILSGIYSYLLLYAVARFAGNVFRHYSPEWAFLPTILVAFLIFKSRLIKLGKFMQTVYTDKRDPVVRSMTPARIAILATALVALLGMPYLRDTVPARFILEPVQRAVVRAEIPGTVVEVFVHEGQKVEPGNQLLRLRNLDLESQQALLQADLQLERSGNTEPQMHYTGPAVMDKEFKRNPVESPLVSPEARPWRLLPSHPVIA